MLLKIIIFLLSVTLSRCECIIGSQGLEENEEKINQIDEVVKEKETFQNLENALGNYDNGNHSGEVKENRETNVEATRQTIPASEGLDLNQQQNVLLETNHQSHVLSEEYYTERNQQDQLHNYTETNNTDNSSLIETNKLESILETTPVTHEQLNGHNATAEQSEIISDNTTAEDRENSTKAQNESHKSFSTNDLAGTNFLPKTRFFGLNLLGDTSKERKYESSSERRHEKKDFTSQYQSAENQRESMFSRDSTNQRDTNRQENIMFEPQIPNNNRRTETGWYDNTSPEPDQFFTMENSQQDSILFSSDNDKRKEPYNPTGSNIIFSDGHSGSSREDNVFFKERTTEPARKQNLLYDNFYKRKNSLFYADKDTERYEPEETESNRWESTTSGRLVSTTERSIWSDNSATERDRPNASSSQSKQSLVPQEKCGLDVPRRIIGGSTTDIDEFPWLCQLQYIDPSGKVSHDCSGALISRRYVLTAAHCTHGLGVTSKNMKVRKVKLGEWDLSTDKDCQGDVCSAPVQEIQVEDIIPHEKYKPKSKTQDNDIALIRLRDEATLNQFVQPICLPFDSIGNTDYEDKKLTVSGWGRTSNAKNSASSIKKKVDLPVVNRDRCRQFYQSFYGDLKISQNQFCAGGEDGQDSCQGDSGGPLMTTERTESEFKWYIIGIVSSGPAACGVKDRPSLYTNVSRYTDWILDNIRS